MTGLSVKSNHKEVSIQLKSVPVIRRNNYIPANERKPFIVASN